jgi:hypothetical protein
VGDDSLLVLLSLLYARAVPKSAADDRASSCPFRIAVSSLGMKSCLGEFFLQSPVSVGLRFVRGPMTASSAADHPNDASGLTFAHLYDVICRCALLSIAFSC